MRLLRLLLGILTLCAFAGCGDASVTQKEGYAVDHSDPAKVLTAVFDAARGASASILEGLCDPLGQNDLDTKRICDQAQGFDPEGEFAVYFRTAEQTGEARINGDTAIIPFEFGPGQPRSDEMHLIRRDGKWYLLKF